MPPLIADVIRRYVFARFKVSYVAWQNRATRFYLAARSLYLREYFAPAAFCSVQALELILKATLVYWVRGFDPNAARHRLAAMTRTIRQRVPGATSFDLPRYFFHEQRFYSVSRYPAKVKGLLLPASLIDDLDEAFITLVCTVPFQFNTELRRAALGKPRRSLLDLRRRNEKMRILRRHLAQTRTGV